MSEFLRRVIEFPFLVFLNLYYTVKSLIEYIQVIFRYYSNPTFRKADWALLKAYLFKNPYRMHKKFMQERGEENVYVYGETYITTMDKLVALANINSTDTFVELGCGRGRCCFWVYAFKKCKVIGIDYVPEFIDIANTVVEKLGLENIEFYCDDFLTNKEIEQGTVFYVDATLMENHEVGALCRMLDREPPGTRVISVNMSLTGTYPENRPWRQIGSLLAPFPWGKAETLIFEKI